MMIVGTIQQEVKSILSLSSILFITSIHPQNFLNLWVSSTKGLRQKLFALVMRADNDQHCREEDFSNFNTVV
jgi:hypothetical protein